VKMTGLVSPSIMKLIVEADYAIVSVP
jgi:hypothetical protein